MVSALRCSIRHAFDVPLETCSCAAAQCAKANLSRSRTKADLSCSRHTPARLTRRRLAPGGMDEQGIAFLVATAFDAGRSLLNFCDSNTSTDREFANFSDDVNAFASAWSIIQPSLRDPNVALSPSLLRILGLISNDGTAILARLRESITALNSRYRKIGIAATRNVMLRIGSHYKTRCHQLLMEFLGQQLVVLHRSQIIFATSTLNVILVVVQWVHPNVHAKPSLSNSSAVTPEQDLHDSTRASILIMSCTSSASSSVQELRLRPRRPYSGTLRLEQRYGFRLFPKGRQEGTRYSTSSPRNGHNRC